MVRFGLSACYLFISKIILRLFHCRITQGSEAEVDESIPKKNRALIEVEIESQYPIYPIKMEFDTVKAEERRDGYMELRCSDIIQNVSVLNSFIISGVLTS